MQPQCASGDGLDAISNRFHKPTLFISHVNTATVKSRSVIGDSLVSGSPPNFPKPFHHLQSINQSVKAQAKSVKTLLRTMTECSLMVWRSAAPTMLIHFSDTYIFILKHTLSHHGCNMCNMQKDPQKLPKAFSTWSQTSDAII